MTVMFIVDSQIHIWKEESPDRPWVPGARQRLRMNGHREEPFSYQECISLMDEAGADRALIVPPSWEGDRIDYALEACEARRGRRDAARLRAELARQGRAPDVPPAD
jgi:predicted TIM-barrel fold metal-dependent hydrolase